MQFVIMSSVTFLQQQQVHQGEAGASVMMSSYYYCPICFNGLTGDVIRSHLLLFFRHASLSDFALFRLYSLLCSISLWMPK